MIDEDLYYDNQLAEYMERAKVPFEDYKELEEKYDELVNVVNTCLETERFEELKEYMEDNFR